MSNYSSDDFYEVLGVAPDETDKNIKKAYRRLMQKFHPDRPESLDHVKKMFKKRRGESSKKYNERIVRERDDIASKIGTAGDTLSKKRSAYDKSRASNQKKKSYSDGTYYEGDLVNDVAEGEGVLYASDGTKLYEGEWKEGNFHGKGTAFFSDGNIYEGQWQRGEKHGQGIFRHVNGSEYSGEWKNGNQHGQGTQTYTDGSKYEGGWHNDQQHGQGPHTYADGTVKTGQWTNGAYNAPSSGASGHGAQNRSGSAAQIPDYNYKIRPFILRDFGGFLTKSYGVENDQVYVQDDFLGIIARGRRPLDLSSMNPPASQGALLGSVEITCRNTPSVEWKNIVMPQQKAAMLEKMRKGKYVEPQNKVSTNLVTIFGIAAFTFLLNVEAPDSNTAATGWGAYTQKSSKDPDTRQYSGLIGENFYNGDVNDGVPHGDGTMKYADGSKYQGTWEDGKRDTGLYDYGTMTYADGSEYRGKWWKGKPHGKGTMTYADGSEYRGTWEDGKRYEYDSTMTYADGSRYKGESGNEKPHGKGTMHYPDGSEYQGKWKDGKRHGDGTMIYADVSSYQGAWEDGKRHGDGVFISVNGDQYVGKWSSDLQVSVSQTIKKSKIIALNNGRFRGVSSPQCIGVMTYIDGRKYAGECHIYKKHTPQGQGVMLYPDGRQYLGRQNPKFSHKDQTTYSGVIKYADGSWYQGEWGNEKPHGKGTMHYPDGSEYQGKWKDGKRHTEHYEGTMTYADGSSYQGGWRDGKRHTEHYEGTMTYANGDQYVGSWKNGKRNGEGNVVYGKSGDTYSGYWVNDKKHGSGTYISADGTVTPQKWRDGKKRKGQRVNIFTDNTVKKQILKKGRVKNPIPDFAPPPP